MRWAYRSAVATNADQPRVAHDEPSGFEGRFDVAILSRHFLHLDAKHLWSARGNRRFGGACEFLVPRNGSWVGETLALMAAVWPRNQRFAPLRSLSSRGAGESGVEPPALQDAGASFEKGWLGKLARALCPTEASNLPPRPHSPALPTTRSVLEYGGSTPFSGRDQARVTMQSKRSPSPPSITPPHHSQGSSTSPKPSPWR